MAIPQVKSAAAWMESDNAPACLAVCVHVQVWKNSCTCSIAQTLSPSDGWNSGRLLKNWLGEMAGHNCSAGPWIGRFMHCPFYRTQSAGNHCNTVLVQQKKLLFHWKCSGRHKCTPAMSPTFVHHRGGCFLSTQMSSRRSTPLNNCGTVQRPNKVFQTINLSPLPGMKTGVNELWPLLPLFPNQSPRWITHPSTVPH